MKNWRIHLDREEDENVDPTDQRWSISLSEYRGGWDTDSGYDGYGLPKELAQWICDILISSEIDCPYYVDQFGCWHKNE